MSVDNVDADTQTGPSRAPSTADDEKARAAIGMVTDLLSALTADGDTDATQIGTTLLDTLGRDRLAALGADPDDLDTLDHLRSLGSGRSDETRTGPRLTGGDQSSAAGTGSTPPPTPALEQLSSGESEVRPGEVITRTQSTQPSRATTDTASGAASSAGQHTSTSATPETSTSRAGSVAAGIEKLRAQARAAAEVDPLAQDLLDALDRTTSTGVEDRTVSAGERPGRPTSDNDPNKDSDPDKDSDTVSADLTGGAGDRAGHQPDTPRPATLTSGSAAKKPATGSGAEPPPATGDAETGPAADSTFDNLAQCESGGDWASDTGNGYHGGLQFSPSTWRAFGGEGAAHEASRAEQIEVAKRVQAVQGWAAWPACSQRLGLR
ncbi:hypothetical protein Ae717Ps2_6466c [Pseudonocardia sp. Ae717_Ps2]|nr:hypothetical protein Ae717Ps2_6466c [Pseudonocardia sp. Ae717_Ps2]